MQVAFRSFYRTASLIKNVSLEAALTRVMEYSKDGESVFLHPNFPKAPIKVYNTFVKKKGYTNLNLPAKLRADFRNRTDPDVEICEEEYLHEQKQYIQALEKFLRENDDLFPEHVQCVKKKIRILHNKLNVKFINYYFNHFFSLVKKLRNIRPQKKKGKEN